MQNETTPILKLNDKRITNGWAFFDCANSAYSLVVTTAIFPVISKILLRKRFLFWV